MGSSNKIRSLLFLCTLFIALLLLLGERGGAQPLSAGQAASSAGSRLVGTVEGGPFSGAVFDDGTGVQVFYRLHDQLPDGSRLLKVRSKSIVVKKTDGALYEIFTTTGANSTVTAMPSPSVTPSEPRESMPNSATKPRQRRGRAGRVVEREEDE